MIHLQLPKNVNRLGTDEVFSFLCHPGISCFTHCCRQLDLALSPYDVLRMKKATGLTSSEFLARYVIIEQGQAGAFPRFYLTMIDDGKASCIFVTPQGCNIYEDRPGACRAYPTGRAAMSAKGSTVKDYYVLLQEKHCRGFGQGHPQTAAQYCQDQGLSTYNRFNDAVATILQHEKIRQGMLLSKEQIDSFTLALYDIDTFRKMIFSNSLPHIARDASQLQELEKDEPMLLFAIDWLRNVLFADDRHINPDPDNVV
jgi:uncharacterized protein